MNKNIHDQEDVLHDEWLKSYSKEEQEQFCMDGLCSTNDVEDEYGDEEKLWAKAKRRIVFLMKETNGNPDNDYRGWQWPIINHRTFNIVFKWLQGLSTVTASFCPSVNHEGDYFETPNEVIGIYPLAIVNVKKIAGSTQASISAIQAYAERDKDFIRKQVAEILQPNIVVCCGYSDNYGRYMTEIAKNYIYPDLSFKEINNWCFYCKEKNLLLIDSWHPGARKSQEEKIDEMMINVQELIKAEHSNF
jgi:hypothetical protein